MKATGTRRIAPSARGCWTGIFGVFLVIDREVSGKALLVARFWPVVCLVVGAGGILWDLGRVVRRRPGRRASLNR